jgi:predicted thioredoxin/glutaredoxin
MSDTAFTLTDGLVLSQPIIFLNGELFLWNPPDLDKAKAAPNGQGWEEWLAEEGGRDAIWKLFEIVTPKPGECAA